MFPIIITSIAQDMILAIKEQKNITQEYALRIGIKGDGCQKDTPFMGFDTPRLTDKTFEKIIFSPQNNFSLDVIIHIGQIMYLLDWVLDYKDEQNEKGFYFYKNHK